KIPNGVDTDIFRPVSKEERQRFYADLNLPRYSYIIFCGRLEEKKGIIFLIKAWQNLKDELEDFRLLICGGGSQERYLKELTKKLGLSDSVIFTGEIRNVEVYLKISQIFVLPSLHEGLPNALLEAMSCGLAVVASRVNGVKEIVVDGFNGLLVEPKDIKGLIEKISILAKDKDLRLYLGQNARKTILKSYSIDIVAERHICLYEKLLK
ncbi:MAG: glycosyltransferase, partial [Candidatus Omnitrophica bacterium]|nr:glycosyltransferase [Candidatus Omnitrophota bacterium]